MPYFRLDIKLVLRPRCGLLGYISTRIPLGYPDDFTGEATGPRHGAPQ